MIKTKSDFFGGPVSANQSY